MNRYNSTFKVKPDAKPMRRMRTNVVRYEAPRDDDSERFPKAKPEREVKPLVSRNCNTQPNRICANPECRKPFRVPNSRIGKVCSLACLRVIRRTRITRNCQQCGNAFLINPSQFNHYPGAGKFCSKRCHGDAKIAATANAPTRDRYHRTSRHADKIWQKEVREKDDYTCQRCGIRDPYIHAHHVAPRSRRPDLKFVVENGKCLCNSCHTWVHWHPKEATAAGLLSDAAYECRTQKEPVLCKVCGSDNRHAGYGYCIKHYKRFKKYGDPLLTGRRGHPGESPVKVDANA